MRIAKKKKKVRTNRVALHSVGSRAELSLRLCFAALSHRMQHKHGGTNPSLKNTHPPLHLKCTGIRYLSRHCKICISEWHLQLYPPHSPRDVSFNFSYFDFYERFMPRLTQNTVCIRTAFVSWTIHHNNVRADPTSITCSECSSSLFLIKREMPGFPPGLWKYEHDCEWIVAFQWLWEACVFVLVHMLVCVRVRTLASGLSPW